MQSNLKDLKAVKPWKPVKAGVVEDCKFEINNSSNYDGDALQTKTKRRRR